MNRTARVNLSAVLVALGVVWFVAGMFILPGILEAVYDGRVFPAIVRAVPAIHSRPASFFENQLFSMTLAGSIACLALGGFVHLLRADHASEQLVGTATPGALGAIRMLVCGVLLTSALWEHLPSTAYLPGELIHPMGVIHLLGQIPGFKTLTASPTGLLIFQWLTITALACGFFGWRVTWTLPVAAVCYFVFAGLFRQYAWFYHTGLVPAYVLVVLCFLPSADGWSIDRLSRIRRNEPTADAGVATYHYGWARYAVWTTIALPYFAAGFSKIRNAGLMWWDAENFRNILYASSLQPMQFDFKISLLLVHIPDFVIEIMALAALGGEVLFILVLFFRWARKVLPATMAAMHLGILFLQNILFLDLLILQAVFYDFGPARRRIAEKLSGRFGLVYVSYDDGNPAQVQAARFLGALDLFDRIRFKAVAGADLHAVRSAEHFDGPAFVRLMAAILPALWVLRPVLSISAAAAGADVWLKREASIRQPSNRTPYHAVRSASPRLVTVLSSLLMFCWVFRIEVFPFTGMQMFSNIRGSVVTYEYPWARLASGSRIRAPIESTIPAMRDSRYRRILQRAFSSEPDSTVYRFFDTVGGLWNEDARDGERIVSFEIERRSWDFGSDPDDPNYGDLVDTRTYSLASTGPVRPRISR